MDDCISIDERTQFSLLGPIRPAAEYPYREMDSYFHMIDLSELGERPKNIDWLMKNFNRFGMAFNGDDAVGNNQEFKLYF